MDQTRQQLLTFPHLPAKDGNDVNSIDNETYDEYSGPTDVAATDCESKRSDPAKRLAIMFLCGNHSGGERHGGTQGKLRAFNILGFCPGAIADLTPNENFDDFQWSGRSLWLDRSCLRYACSITASMNLFCNSSVDLYSDLSIFRRTISDSPAYVRMFRPPAPQISLT